MNVIISANIIPISINTGFVMLNATFQNVIGFDTIDNSMNNINAPTNTKQQ